MNNFFIINLLLKLKKTVFLKFRTTVFIFLILLSFASCSKKTGFENTSYVKESKSLDIPVPLGFKFKNSLGCYSGALPKNQVSDFYKTNLENLGWDIKDYSNNVENLLYCNKVRKSAIISIRGNGDQKSQVFIFEK